MRPDLRERRRETYRLLYRLGIPYSETVARIADEYSVTESAIENDIAKMSGWISEIDVPLHDGLLRVRQVREQVQELERLAIETRRNGDLAETRRTREAIVKAIDTEDRMASRLGLTNESFYEMEIGTLTVDEEELVKEFCGLTNDTVELEECR